MVGLCSSTKDGKPISCDGDMGIDVGVWHLIGRDPCFALGCLDLKTVFKKSFLPQGPYEVEQIWVERKYNVVNVCKHSDEGVGGERGEGSGELNLGKCGKELVNHIP